MSESNGGAAPSPSAELHQGAIPGEQAIENASDEIQDQLSADPEQTETPAQAAARKKKFQIKANNKVRDVEIDLDNDDELKRYIEKAYGADEKFQEAAMTRKQAEALIELLKNDPLKVLTHPDLGLDIKALAHKVINQELEEMSLTPEQKRLKEMEEKLKEYEENEKKTKEEKRKAELEKFELEQQQLLDEQITSALSSTTLPKSPYVVKRIADAMIEAVGMGYENVTPEQVMPFVEQSVKRELSEMFGSLPDQVLEELVGKTRLDGYRKARIEKAKKAPSNVKPKDTGASVKPKEESKEEEKIRFKDLFSPF